LIIERKDVVLVMTVWLLRRGGLCIYTFDLPFTHPRNWHFSFRQDVLCGRGGMSNHHP
jgi:hypothetical protein